MLSANGKEVGIGWQKGRSAALVIDKTGQGGFSVPCGDGIHEIKREKRRRGLGHNSLGARMAPMAIGAIIFALVVMVAVEESLPRPNHQKGKRDSQKKRSF